jgi:Neutral/alkaline non-lysosomal ceramidase, N-terminal
MTRSGSRKVAGWARAFALAAAPLLSACGLFVSPDGLHPDRIQPILHQADSGPIEAGAGRVDLTPTDPIYLGGFGIMRESTGVHDPITARALAVRRGDLVTILIGVDLIGLHHHHVSEVRDRLRDVACMDAILIACTHTHSAPDTLGMWGLPPLISGIDDDYLAFVLDGIERAARAAVDDLGPAVASWGSAQAPAEGISKNKRQPDLIDRTLTAVAFDRPDGTPVATLVHFACHPEALGSKNDEISSDFPHALRETVEAGRPGSVTVYLNGPLGGMVTTDEAQSTFEETERIGRALGELALGALAEPTPLGAELDLTCVRQPIRMPITNRRYHLGNAFGIFGGRPFIEGGYTLSEVMAWRLGPLTLLSAPGELLPRVGFEFEELVADEPRLVVSLGNDEMGYIIHEEDFGDERYDYEETVSPGPLATTAIRLGAIRAVERLLGSRPRAELPGEQPPGERSPRRP